MMCWSRRVEYRQPIRLLVVEDDPAYLYLIQQAFRERKGKPGWELSIAKSGEEAVHALFEEEDENQPLPDLILLDWHLPNMSGSEVLHLVKRHEKLRKIPTLVFSSSDAAKDIHSAYDGHANGYITKPSAIDAITRVIETIEDFWIAVARLPKVVR
jgi:chemotaxis family two-component system response regulator Rcp1